MSEKDLQKTVVRVLLIVTQSVQSRLHDAPQLQEKVLAKYLGNYWHIENGINSDGVSLLNGSPSYYLRHFDSSSNSEEVEEFWDHI